MRFTTTDPRTGGYADSVGGVIGYVSGGYVSTMVKVSTGDTDWASVPALLPSTPMGVVKCPTVSSDPSSGGRTGDVNDVVLYYTGGAARYYIKYDTGNTDWVPLPDTNSPGGGSLLTGSGTLGRSVRFTGASSLGNGAFTDDGTNVTLGGTLTLTPMATGSVLFAGAAGLVSQDNAKLYWDNTNFRWGVGTASPTHTLDARGSVASADIGRVQNSSASGYSSLAYYDSTPTGKGYLGYANGSAPDTTVAGKNYWRTLTADWVLAYGASDPSTLAVTVIGSNGNVNVGPTSGDPGVRFRAEGNTAFGTTTSSTHAFTGPVTITGSGVYPQKALNVTSTGQTNAWINGGSGTYTGLVVGVGGTEKWYVGLDGTGATDGLILRRAGATDDFKLDTSGNAKFTGMVGIGATPTKTLLVKASVAGDHLFDLWNTSATGFSAVDVLDSGGTSRFGWGTDNGSSRSYISLNNSWPMIITGNGSRIATVYTNGNWNLGSSTSDPGVNLQVEGNVLLSASSAHMGLSGTSSTLALRDASPSNTYALEVHGGSNGSNIKVYTTNSGHNSNVAYWDSSGTQRAQVLYANSASGDSSLRSKLAIWHDSSTEFVIVGNTTGSPRFALRVDATTDNVTIPQALTVTGLSTLTGGFTLGADSSAGSHKITSLTDGSSAQDAAAYHQIGDAVNAAVSGTSNTVAKFTGTHVIGNSLITDDGTTINLGGGKLANTYTGTGDAATISCTGTGLTADLTITDFNSSATFDTTAGARQVVGMQQIMTASRSAGANNLNQYGLLLSASGAQVNVACRTNSGDVWLNTSSGNTAIGYGAGSGPSARLGVLSSANTTNALFANTSTGQTTATINVSCTMSGTMNAAANRTFTGLKSFVTMTNAGSNTLTNLAGYFSATGGDVNTALQTDDGNVKLNNVSGSLTCAGASTFTNTLMTSGEVAPSQITSNQDNYAPTGWSTCTVAYLTSDASRNITGFGNPVAGRHVWVYNGGSNNIVLKHKTTSTAANQICGRGNADTTLTAGTGVHLYYSAAAGNFWVVMTDTL